MTDFEVIKLILGGEKEKFRQLVEKHQQLVFRTCMGFLHNKDDADDLTQEVFIQAYQSLSRFKGDSAFSTWIYRIAVNASLNKVRKSSVNIFLHGIETIFGGDKSGEVNLRTHYEEDPENLMIRQENIQWVKKALDALPEKQRTAIVLSKYDELSQREIAAIMNISEGAVEALIQRAKKNLREKLSYHGKKYEY